MFCKTFCIKRKKKSCTAAANLPAARLRRRTSPRRRPSVTPPGVGSVLGSTSSTLHVGLYFQYLNFYNFGLSL